MLVALVNDHAGRAWIPVGRIVLPDPGRVARMFFMVMA